LTLRNPILDNARMPETIIIERLEFRGRCGITPEERARPQPLAVDLELEWSFRRAGHSDDLAQTIDYAKAAQRVVEVGTEKDASLLESIAERLLAMLFAEFPVDRVRLWLRKLHPPMDLVTGSVGISCERTRAAHQLQQTETAPARFLVQQLHRLPEGTALDVAAGTGRNALFLASRGYQVNAIDRDADALARLASTAKKAALPTVSTRTMDLEQPAPSVPDLGKEAYDVVIVFFYLYRSLFPHLMDALKPGGVLVYETFTIDNYFHHKHPRRWEFCLAQNELLRLTSSLHVWHYDEGEHESGHASGPVYTAQLVAQKPTRQGSPA
jgi:dihydroneopterin aldolase